MKFRTLIIIFVSALLVSGVTLYSCTRKKVDYLGPEYLSAPAGFTASNLTVSTNVDFTVANCFVTATFSDRVTYTVTFKGKTSGAVRSYTGVDDHISASTEGGIWNGSHEGLYFFRSGENVEVTVTFLRSDVTLKKTILIVNERDYFTGNPDLKPIGATKIATVLTVNNSFELTAVVPGSFPYQFAFANAGGPNAFVNSVAASNYGIKAIQGLNVFNVTGVSTQSDGFFVGGVQNRVDNPGSTTSFMLPANWTDPAQIYFNVYIYGNGASNAIVNLEFHESDASNPKNSGGKKDCGGSSLGAYDHDPCTDDGWVYPVPVDFIGWRLVSVKYSDFARSVSLPNGGSGDGKKEPTRVARVQMGVVSSPAFKEASVMMDYPVVSYGAPFDPSK